FIPGRMRSARSPASRRAYGSRNRASRRSDSIARYNATQRAVSETCWMASVMAGKGNPRAAKAPYLFSRGAARDQPVAHRPRAEWRSEERRVGTQGEAEVGDRVANDT